MADLRASCAVVAAAVAEAAVRDGAAGRDLPDAGGAVREAMWRPEYGPPPAAADR
ncbi:hypothetical protein RKE29_22470 [Streptomyces sp. B1866]|uniref:hypothetical protein n=1 Tax=Streptomyces sp. B1866 TaxID=3075431 RepID=UPI00288F7FDE|nr:hypothetical protein [Streptomyces sp. B1866]MDT3399377.1 hypothetical protein [Streptomyces sp. B1866]